MLSKNKLTHTKKLNPKWGMLGILGLLGFTGLIPEQLGLLETMPVPSFFFFFTFFGFFGFYYQGKMSNTFIDERFKINVQRASAIANKVALCAILGVSLITMSIVVISDTYAMLSILIATIGFAFGLSIFLEQYLLYRFENEE